MADKGDSKPVAPSPGEYEKLRHEAESLRHLGGESKAQQSRAQSLGEMNKYMRYTGMGMQFVVMMGLPMALGWWIDGLVGSRPWLMVAGAVLGIVAAMVFVVRTVLRMEAAEGKGKGRS
jgi:F0F1-type ATP synthase assembly protein I